MASSSMFTKFPFILRLTHSILHVLTALLIIAGVSNMPDSKKSKLAEVAIRRAVFWIACEIIYALISTSALTIFVKATSRGAIRSKIFEKCPNLNFFYYTLMTMVVLYGTMTGCNIPYLFNKSPLYSSVLPKLPTRAWQVFTIVAVLISIFNSILYFVAAFYPILGSEEEANAEQQNETCPKQSSTPMPAEVAEADMNGEMGENGGADAEEAAT
ncbi:hypothetical protein Ocin01_02886 [Orchesella cincta]|uniref:Uncharacterized protein n=1 Tax=Orchesella cincta TaxID=48709 RepID=A0A1D2NEW9_ORCCI|nr:hypothetical protein Ocin01_02886 [Orchesella cincta]